MQKGFKQVNLEGCVSGTLAVPVIGENGNWFIGNDDTGVCAIGSGNGDTHYSFEEQIIGTWVDGSALYRKTIKVGALPSKTTKTVPHGISNIGYMVKFSATAKNSIGTQLDLPYCSTNTYDNYIAAYLTSAGILIKTAADWSDYSICFVTLEYTKTSESV